MKRTYFLLIAASLCSGSASFAYEIGTHAKITQQAYVLSTLQTSDKLKQLGLLDLTGIVGKEFTEFTGAQEQTRRQFQFERNVMFNAIFERKNEALGYPVFPYRPVGWLVTGAIREDDGSVVYGLPRVAAGPSTFADIYLQEAINEVLALDTPMGGHFNRFCNHFYDPTKGGSLFTSGYSDVPNCPLTGVVGQQTGIASAAWALALQRGTTIFQAAEELQTRTNHFAISDAKEAMWRAATGYDSAMTTKVALTGTQRMRYWVTVFRSLGGVVHLLQDIAQAQHTRNEGHPSGQSKSYERYVEWRTATVGQQVVLDKAGQFQIEVNPLANPWPADMWASYPTIPSFSKYEHYWHASTGQGLAVYSNQGFLTPSKNIGNTAYTLPPTDAFNAAYTPVTLQETVDKQIVNVTRLNYAVPDTLTNLPTVIPMTRKTTFDWLRAQGAGPSTTQGVTHGPDEKIYAAQASLQLPRAVAYSAGLIDHFFRGQLRIEAPAEGYFAIADTAYDDAADVRRSTQGFKQIKFRMTNTTAPRGTPTLVEQHMSNAKVVAVVRYQANTCYTANLLGQWQAPGKNWQACRGPNGYGGTVDDILKFETISTSSPCTIAGATSGISLPVGTTVNVTCNFSSAEIIPYSGTDMKLMLAVRGTLGEEDNGLIVQQIDIQEPAFVVDQNSTDYLNVNTVVYPGDHVFSVSETENVNPAAIHPDTHQIRQSWKNYRYTGFIRDATPAQKQTLRYALNPGEFTRVALLLPELDAPPVRYVTAGNYCDAGYFPVNADVLTSELSRTLLAPIERLPGGLAAWEASTGSAFSAAFKTQTWWEYLVDQIQVTSTRWDAEAYSSKLRFAATNPGELTYSQDQNPEFMASRGHGSASPCVAPVGRNDISWVSASEAAKMDPLPTSTPVPVEFCSTADCYRPWAVCTGATADTCSLVAP